MDRNRQRKEGSRAEIPAMVATVMGSEGSQAIHALHGLTHFRVRAQSLSSMLWHCTASARLGSPGPASPGRLHSHLSLCRWLVSTVNGPHPHPHPLLSPGLGLCRGVWCSVIFRSSTICSRCRAVSVRLRSGRDGHAKSGEDCRASRRDSL